MYYSDDLYHYGVKGMKWGVRKDRIKAGTDKFKKKVKGKIQSRKQRKSENRKIRTRIDSINKAQRKRAMEIDINLLDDIQLNKLNNRIKSENQYKDYIRVVKRKRAGLETAKKILGRNANKVIDPLVISAMTGVGMVDVSLLLGNEKAWKFKNIVTKGG